MKSRERAKSAPFFNSAYSSTPLPIYTPFPLVFLQSTSCTVYSELTTHSGIDNVPDTPDYTRRTISMVSRLVWGVSGGGEWRGRGCSGVARGGGEWRGREGGIGVAEGRGGTE